MAIVLPGRESFIYGNVSGDQESLSLLTEAEVFLFHYHKEEDLI